MNRRAGNSLPTPFTMQSENPKQRIPQQKGSLKNN